ncbi:SRPBCC domain-containing protein [Phaeodactylibacter sp.]|uniref:SRPBCC domain-containing protein n=1 Tax=Phaeodactylibacter sp. TaxID=1940289 RepID=UPI0025F49364|nr:SRPBCC domain-containing protein [Phaeodactylibacter sp.]MCI4651708.1 SRPBCC domain-containing protein [Phaeodactylibacter sp.]MCI5090836.1 SRPBCC domain-containing protein [Phaeodactylibacter sp.]
MTATILIILFFLILLLGLSLYNFEVRAEILIDETPDKVWKTLIQMERYGDWNDQLQFMGGTPAKGEIIKLKLSVEGATPYEFSPTINHWEEGKKFGWIARTGFPGVFDGEHLFELEERQGQTFLINRERYSGFLAPFIQHQPMMKNAPQGFEKMNQQLKKFIDTSNG